MVQSQSVLRYALVAAIAVHALLLFTGFFGLVAVFDFPDILRASPAQILATFRSQRALVQGFYAAFMWSQVAFVCVVLALRARFGERSVPLLRAATHLGVLAGFAQAVGFARWPFVVGSLADAYPRAPEVTLTVLETVHRLAGVAIGEHLFFCFEALWAIATGVHLLGDRGPTHVSKGAALLLVGIGSAIGVYSLEQFGGPFAVLGPINVLAHGALLFWLIGVAISELLQRPLRRWEVLLLAGLWGATVLG
jgi:hypothetical protein